MRRVLIITNKVPHYRVPLYDSIGRHYDLTVAHNGSIINSTSFHENVLSEKKIGPLIYFNGMYDPAKFDVVIVYLNIRLVNLYKLLWSRKRTYKIILYGIGVSASYTKKYDRNKLVGLVSKILIQKADASIFYDNYPVIKYSSMGVPTKKMFVAANTVLGNRGGISQSRDRHSFIFIGTLYKEKGISQLLEAYKLGLQKGIKLPKLNIIGDGPDRRNIESWISKNGLAQKVNILGQIEEEDKLALFFNDALCCVSPAQAGLSVQKSFSFGVPFITSYYPISGGEFTSIINGITGFFYDGTTDDLLKKMVEAIEHPALDVICENCKEFYERFRSPEVWLNGFKDAIEYVSR